MPKFISKEGVWYPQKERVALKNLSKKIRIVDGKEVKPGEDYIYEGPDRAALFELFKLKVDTLGQDFRKDTEFLQAVRNMGFKDTEDYLKFIGYDHERVEKEFKEKAVVVTKHELPEKVAAIETLGGGVDTAGEAKPRYGGFGDQPEG